MARVIHFELPADKPERAVKFYEGLFGWKIDKWDGPVDYWLVTTGEEGEPGINGAIKDKATPESVTCNTLGVDSIDVYFNKVKGAGGQVLTEKMEIPGIGWHGYCKDTEGNIVGLMEELKKKYR